MSAALLAGLGVGVMEGKMCNAEAGPEILQGFYYPDVI